MFETKTTLRNIPSWLETTELFDKNQQYNRKNQKAHFGTFCERLGVGLDHIDTHLLGGAV
jgi:hypothetical protein